MEKELQELVEKEIDAKQIANEIKSGMKDLQEFLKTKLRRKLIDLVVLQDSGFGVDEELMDVEFKDLKIFHVQDYPNNTCSNLLKKVIRLTYVLHEIDANHPLQLPMKKIETHKKQAMDLYQRLIEVELDCLKYNLPNFDQIQKLHDCQIKMKKYMKTWEEEAKMYREKGYKTFKELLEQVAGTSQEGYVTLEEVRAIVIETGAKLARLLVEFLFLVTRTTKELATLLDWIRTTLECIIVEDNYITVHIVLNRLELAETQAMEEKLIIQRNRSLYISPEEFDIYRKILRECVRFEVCFCCPSLPFMYSNDVLRSMGELFKIHSEEKMNRISYKIGELKKVEKETKGDVEDLKMNQLKLIFYSHIEDKI